MTIDIIIVIYVIGILIEIGILFIKPRFIAFFPVMISCVAFLYLKDSNIFNLAIIQSFILAFGLFTFYIVDSIISKKRHKKIEKTIIKDI